MRKLLIYVLSLLIVLGITGCESQTIKLKQETVTIECGETLAKNLLDYVDTSEIDDTKEVTYASQNIKDFTKPLAVGEYEIEYTYKNEKYPLKIVIKDTKAPEVKVKSDIKALEDEEVDYANVLDIQDASEYTIEVSDENKQFDKEGHYDVDVSIKDVCDNTTKVTVPVDVEAVSLNLSKSKVSLTEGKSTKLNATTNSLKNISFHSGNTSVATVDNDGNIEAMNPGKTTITASIGNKEETCAVTVNAKPKATTQSTYRSKTTSAPSNDNISYEVYVTKTGSKFHRDGCRYLSRSQIPMSRSAAVSEGYEPCSVCNP